MLCLISAVGSGRFHRETHSKETAGLQGAGRLSSLSFHHWFLFFSKVSPWVSIHFKILYAFIWIFNHRMLKEEMDRERVLKSKLGKHCLRRRPWKAGCASPPTVERCFPLLSSKRRFSVIGENMRSRSLKGLERWHFSGQRYSALMPFLVITFHSRSVFQVLSSPFGKLLLLIPQLASHFLRIYHFLLKSCREMCDRLQFFSYILTSGLSIRVNQIRGWSQGVYVYI